MSNNREEKMLAKAGGLKGKKTNLTFKSETSTPKKMKAPTVKRDIGLKSYVTKAEKDKFLSLIGRKSESDAIRQLVLDFNKKNKNLV